MLWNYAPKNKICWVPENFICAPTDPTIVLTDKSVFTTDFVRCLMVVEITDKSVVTTDLSKATDTYIWRIVFSRLELTLHTFFTLVYVNQPEFKIELIFSKVPGFFGWTNIEHNKKIQKSSSTLSFGGRRFQRTGISLQKSIVGTIFRSIAAAQTTNKL
jgi:hypothetical protein